LTPFKKNKKLTNFMVHPIQLYWFSWCLIKLSFKSYIFLLAFSAIFCHCIVRGEAEAARSNVKIQFIVTRRSQVHVCRALSRQHSLQESKQSFSVIRHFYLFEICLWQKKLSLFTESIKVRSESRLEKCKMDHHFYLCSVFIV
jgi:hypothetical protein